MSQWVLISVMPQPSCLLAGRLGIAGRQAAEHVVDVRLEDRSWC